MLTRLKSAVKRTPFAVPYIAVKSLFTRPGSQNGEGAIIQRLTDRPGIVPRFVEFGFGGWEFVLLPSTGKAC